MNGRERIQAVLAHCEADRVPVDLAATTSSGISIGAYRRLAELLDEGQPAPRVVDVVQQLVDPPESMLDRFGVDAINVWRAYTRDEGAWKHLELPDGAGQRVPLWYEPVSGANGGLELRDRSGNLLGIKPEGADFFDQTVYPFEASYPDSYADLGDKMGRVHWGAYPVAPWDRSGDSDFWEQLRAHTLTLRRESNRALIIQAGGKLVEWGFFLRRIDNFLMDLRAQPAAVEKLLDALLERQLRQLDQICTAVGDLVDIIRFGDDLGMDSGPLMSPITYRQLIKPRHAQLCKRVHERTNAHTMLHSCGSIYRLIPDLIEAGFEILNPVQISSRDMAPRLLKDEFGRDVTFWGGGCDTRSVLNHGQPDEVRAHVLRNLEVFAPDGGFVFCAVHNILPDVPPQNILAMYEAAHDFSCAHYGKGIIDG